ncbi:MAG: hypothetical protein C4293_04040 [Nitrospiraceae bacterium]
MKQFWREQQGVTLIELMAGMAVAIVVVAAGFTALTGSNKATQINDQAAQTQQNARVAMDLLSRDLKMAGFGMTAPVGNCTIGGNAAAIVPADNNPAGADTGPDSVSLAVPTTSVVAPLWQLATQVTGGLAATAIQLNAGAGAAMASAGLAIGGTISIGGVQSATVTAVDDTMGLANAINAPAIYPVGTTVYVLQCITYQIIRPNDANVAVCGGNAPCLVRGVADAVAGPRNCNITPNTCVAIAEGIEDLQLAYACDGCNTAVNGGVEDRIIDDQGAVNNVFEQTDFVSNSSWAAAPMLPSTIRLIRLTIVARQAQNDQGFGEGRNAAISTTAPIIAEDHNPVDGIFVAGDYNATQYSQQRRRVLTRTIQARNLGL